MLVSLLVLVVVTVLLPRVKTHNVSSVNCMIGTGRTHSDDDFYFFQQDNCRKTSVLDYIRESKAKAKSATWLERRKSPVKCNTFP